MRTWKNFAKNLRKRNLWRFHARNLSRFCFSMENRNLRPGCVLSGFCLSGLCRSTLKLSLAIYCQTSNLSLKTWSRLCFTPVTRTTPHQISQLLLTRFWPNFKRRHLRTSRTDSNCYGDICPGNICQGNICQGNICSGDICTYQEYLSCYWQGERQVQCKVKAMSRQGQGKAKAILRQGQGKVNARLRQG